MEVNASEEKFSIKSEYLDVTEEQNVSDGDYKEEDISDEKDAEKFLNTNSIFLKFEIGDESNIKVEETIATNSVGNVSEIIKEENPILGGVLEVCEDIKKIQYREAPQENRRNEALPQELKLDLEGIMLNRSKHNTQDSSKQLTAQSSKINGTAYQPQIKKEMLEKESNFQISTTTNAASISTGAVDRNISFMQNDKESSKNVFICDICGKEFNIKSTLIQHIRKHPEMYSCTYCSFKACRRNSVKSHINCRHTKTSFFTCDYCGYKCFFKGSLSSHINTMHTKNVSFNCSLCSYKAYNKRCLTRHVNVKHTKKNALNCSYCGFRAYRRHILTTHVNAKHTKTNVYNCSYCIYKAHNKHHLTRHVNAKHTKTNVYNCSLCSYEAYDKGTLTRHINAKHTKTNTYNCSHCSYKAYDKGTLTRHVNAKHTKTNAYNCSICSYKAYDKSNLTRHVNAKHTKAIVYNCSLCSYKAYYKRTLTRHVNAKHIKTEVNID